MHKVTYYVHNLLFVPWVEYRGLGKLDQSGCKGAKKKGKVKFYNTHLLRNEQKMTRCYKISAKGNFSKEMFFRSQWVVAFGKSWTLKYKVNSLMFIWHTSPFSALHIFRKSWREKSNKRREKIKSMELVGYSVIQHTVLKITSFTKHLFDLRSSRDTFEEYLSGWLVALFDISI